MGKCKLCGARGLFRHLDDNSLCNRCVSIISSIPKDFTVIDLETTGLDPWKHEILEIGAIKFRDRAEIDRFHTYVMPRKAIPRSATAINGITWETVLKAPSLSKVRDSFLGFVGDDILVGYNVRFDQKFIIVHFDGALATSPTFDVLQISRKLLPSEANYKLDTFRRKYQLKGDAHSVMGDCESTVGLLLHFTKMITK